MLQRIRQWFRPSPTPKPEVKIQVIHREVSRLTVEQWRGDPELVKLAIKVLAEPVIKNMLDVLRNSHIGRYTGTNMTMEGRAIHQAQIEGYNTALNNLEALAVEYKQVQPIEATFERPDLEEAI